MKIGKISTLQVLMWVCVRLDGLWAEEASLGNVSLVFLKVMLDCDSKVFRGCTLTAILRRTVRQGSCGAWPESQLTRPLWKLTVILRTRQKSLVALWVQNQYFIRGVLIYYHRIRSKTSIDNQTPPIHLKASLLITIFK